MQDNKKIKGGILKSIDNALRINELDKLKRTCYLIFSKDEEEPPKYNSKKFMCSEIYNFFKSNNRLLIK